MEIKEWLGTQLGVDIWENKYGKLGKMKCSDIYRYLKEKGEI